MRKKSWVWITFLLLVAIVLFVFFRPWGGIHSSAKALSKDEAQAFVKNTYQGEVTDIKQQGNQFVMEMAKDQMRYKVVLDASTGEVLSLSQIASKPEEKKEPTPEEPKTLTQAEVSQLAVKEVPGRVEDVDLEVSGEDSYYLIEIETADDREAVVQLHAVTGKVVTITWDD